MAALSRVRHMKSKYCIFQAIFTSSKWRCQFATEAARKIDLPSDLKDDAQEGLPDDKPEKGYPAVKPWMPPGSWGEMTRQQAWFWHRGEINHMGRITHVKEKIKFLTDKQMVAWKFPPINIQPNVLNYQLEVTNTILASKDDKYLKPEIYQNVDIKTDYEELKKLCIEAIEIEHALHRDKLKYLAAAKDGRAKSWHALLRGRLLTQTILNAIMSGASRNHEHLQSCSVDKEVTVAACFQRNGVKRPWVPVSRRSPDLSKELYLQNNAMFQGKHVVDFQVRTFLPLPQFISPDHEMCMQADKCVPQYNPKVLGQFRELTQLEITSGFNLGSPNEFTHTSVVCEQLGRLRLVSGEEHWEQSHAGYGLVTNFLSCVAQAHVQGFNMFQDLVYPFTAQTIHTDGRTFRFSMFQLNSLKLWKDPKASPVSNVAWISPADNLYEGLTDDRVIGFNDEVFQRLCQCLLLKPSSRDGIKLNPNVKYKAGTPKILKSVKKVEIEEEVVYDR
ncbi:uncharacterized protein LOC127856135 [Dreissena polymorpha]|uniref:Mitochondrial ribosomal protein L37 n=1 Tax=Dreissena polymorpha TaxID=45954 RepID=A0A9D4C610_DREPO|nr:uncharacterized protein LOC127856135 [Dreissena polymorpha]KAH3717865.1 hypothetical protein DPMN_060661 [Dreissena polymorpha]